MLNKEKKDEDLFVSGNAAKPIVSCRFSDEDVINVITAWESLEGNRSYKPKDIENWLRDYMSPAINRLRAVLNGSKPDCCTKAAKS